MSRKCDRRKFLLYILGLFGMIIHYHETCKADYVVVNQFGAYISFAPNFSTHNYPSPPYLPQPLHMTYPYPPPPPITPAHY